MVDQIVTSGGIGILGEALKADNSLQVNTGLFQFFRQMLKYHPKEVLASGAMEGIIQVMKSHPTEQALVTIFNQLLVPLQSHDLAGRLEILIALVRANGNEKDVVTTCLSNMLPIVEAQREPHMNEAVLALVAESAVGHCDKWQKSCLVQLNLLSQVLIHDEKIRESVKSTLMDKWHNIIISMLSNYKYSAKEEKSYFSKKREQSVEVDSLSPQEKSQ